MILFSQFGYAARHSITYNPKSKPGHLQLWSSYNGSLISTDPLINGDSVLTEFLSHQFKNSSIFGANIYLYIAIGNDDDVFSILSAILMIKAGKDFSFKNFAGRMITFSLTKSSSKANDVILVRMRHNTEIGILMLKELNEFEIITRDILANIGYSKQEITDRVERIMTQNSS
ncbi:MAG: hypothetical protein CL609_25070 [Anaerolineaceae bacterium]|nr:hypothetical protein [Anaerolineaceae bacterium]